MARFVDLDEEDSQAQPMAAWHDAGRPLALGDNGAAVMVVGDGIPPARRFPSRKSTMTEKLQQENASAPGEGKELMAHSAMGEAFQCYPYAIHPFLTRSAKKTRLTLRLCCTSASSLALCPTSTSILSTHWLARAV